jgi:transposase
VRTEDVPWARPAARHSRDLQDVVAYMAQRMDKTTVTRLLRVSWEAVAKIVIDVVTEHIDDDRLDNLFRIGVDEISSRKHHRYLTVVADHDRDGAVVWAKEGRDAATLEAFYDELGTGRCTQLQAVSLDMGNAYKAATDTKAPQARQGLVAAAFATCTRDEDAATTMHPACRDRGECDAHPTSAVLRDMR